MELTCDVLIVGGGCGGVAAALAASDLGHRVVLTEPGDWLGGQLTSQAVPPDEHPWWRARARPPATASCARRFACDTARQDG
jgi:NADPH-dependent 2,4-dienoyl-CoA reductase/sulfur reductase-like enzyme